MSKKKILIIGGAGFIGINAASYFLNKNYQVTIFDNFSRPGSRENVTWLKKNKKGNLKIVKGDICLNTTKLKNALAKADLVLHLAGQVAVTTSVTDPKTDFQINALGTLNVLEAMRQSGNNPVLIYSSTNKVYGHLADVKIDKKATRYAFRNLKHGVSEKRGLDFYSPYGCSKGSADQYVRDYSRIYGLNTIVFRQSCIYGPHQHGVEDQGWVAWFIIALTQGKKITIYGDGKQVRDLLHIDDLLKAYEQAFQNIKTTKGQIYNIGGGHKNTISIWQEFKPILEKLFQRKISVSYSDLRPGDQLIYVSDIRKAKRDFGWVPKIGIKQGIKNLYSWIQENY